LESTGGLDARREGRIRKRIGELVSDQLKVDFWTPERESVLGDRLRRVLSRETTPYDVAKELVEHFKAE
jgi:putative protein kinase ArgK-like GTPase of G3E family